MRSRDRLAGVLMALSISCIAPAASAQTQGDGESEGPGRVAVRVNERNGTTLGVHFDAERRIDETKFTLSGTATVIDHRAYEFDRRSNKTRRRDVLTGLDQHFAYDSSSRLVHSEWTPPPSVAGGVMVPTDYGLDGVGNRSGMAVGSTTTSYALTGLDKPVNQYTTVGTQQREYDANGNLKRVIGSAASGGGATGPGANPGTKPATMVYDARNRMVAYHDDTTGLVHQYRYDCFGRRIAKAIEVGAGGGNATTRFLYAKEQVIEERDASGALLATFVHGKGLDEVLVMSRGGSEHYYASDDQGSVTKLLDGIGQIEERYEYGDFGVLLDGTSLQPLAASAVGNPRFYTGREHDWETGFHQHRKRYMDPGVGRFTTRDPIGIWGDKLNLGNGYTYAANNPWTLTDRTGLWPDWVDSAVDSVGSALSSAGEFCTNAAAGAIDGAISGVTLGMVETTIGADLLGADTDSLAYQGGTLLGEAGAAVALNAATGGCAGAARVVAFAGRAANAVDAIQTAAAAYDAVKDGDMAALAGSLGEAALGQVGRRRGGHGNGPDARPARDGRPEHCGVREGSCFVAGTLVMTACGFTPIEQIELGDRVLTPSAVVDETDVDPATWRAFELVVEDERTGKRCEIELLRPDAWLASLDWDSDGLVWIDLDEVGVEGWAAIASVEPCPPIASGAGRVVTATFRHSGASVLDLRLVDEPAPIRATASHRFYSETRHGWVAAGLLVAGERLRTSSSALVFADAQRVAARFEVFNIEVETEHVYLVSGSGVLVHNECGGRLGNASTRAQNAEIADRLEKDGFTITGGGGRAKEEYIPGPDGGRKGSSYPDITATKDGKTTRINTVDTEADGSLTKREEAAAEKIGKAKPDDDFLVVSKEP
jgi:RHS repeat-associated protein